MLNSSELELKTTLSIGELKTNAEQIKEIISRQLENYKPENYVGKVKEAKEDKAVLNNTAKALNAKRLELEREWLEPFEGFKGVIRETTDLIGAASKELDKIVKAEEQREKDEKREMIMDIWDNQDFTLFDIEKVFNQKWLNKGTKMHEVETEIKAIIQKTFSDLAVIDRLPAEDVPLIKTVYLDTLDLASAMQRADQLKANRDRLAAEKRERAAAEKVAQIDEQKKEERAERHDTEVLELVAETVEEDHVPEVFTFALELSGTREELIAVRQFMSSRGVIYKKLKRNLDLTFSYMN